MSDAADRMGAEERARALVVTMERLVGSADGELVSDFWVRVIADGIVAAIIEDRGKRGNR
jgi:hypothetical protein